MYYSSHRGKNIYRIAWVSPRTNLHCNNITKNFIKILSNKKGYHSLFTRFKLPIFIQTLKLVICFTFHASNPQFLHRKYTHYISTTTIFNDHISNSTLYPKSCMKSGFSLCLINLSHIDIH